MYIEGAVVATGRHGRVLGGSSPTVTPLVLCPCHCFDPVDHVPFLRRWRRKGGCVSGGCLFLCGIDGARVN